MTLVVLALLPFLTFGLLVTNHAGRGTLLGTGIPIAVLCWGLWLYAFRLGFTRKRRSRIDGSLAGTVFTFNGGRFKRSKGDLAKHDRVALRRNGLEHALVFSCDSADGEADQEILVPLRLVRQNAGGHDDLSQALRQVVAEKSMTVTADARSALQSI